METKVNYCVNCGQAPYICKKADSNEYIVVCFKCNRETGFCYNIEQKAVDHWNAINSIKENDYEL